jgi:hypothetical protein
MFQKARRYKAGKLGSIVRSKLTEVFMEYIKFDAKMDAGVSLTFRTSTDFTKLDLTLEQARDLLTELSNAVKVAETLEKTA